MDIGSLLGQLFGMLFGFGFLVLLFGIGFIALLAFIITWIVKKVWYAGEKKPKQHKSTSQNDGYKGNPKENTRWYPTGWTYNDNTKLWEPPDYKNKVGNSWLDKAQDKQNKRFEYMNDAILHDNPNKIWDEERHTWIDKEEEARKERYRKYHEGQPPTFEEWKAQREKEKQEQQK